jgi:hypothetical protein
MTPTRNTRQDVERFLSNTEPATERGKWHTLAINRYTIGEQRLWIATRVKDKGQGYEGMSELIVLAVIILETADSTLELLPPDEKQKK